MPTLRLGIDGRKAKSGAKDYEDSAKRVTKSSNVADKAVQKLALAFGGFLTVRKTVDVLSEFELTMATVRGVTGATEEQFKSMSEAARELGSTTQFSAKEAGDGLLFLARAGFSAEQAVEALPATLDLAVTGMLELGEAADIASNVLSQFGLEAEETSRVVDVLNNTANSANTNIQQLAEGMKFAGPVAGALGQTVENTAAALGVLGDSGIQASLAGTNLRGIMSALLGPTDGAMMAIENLGISMDKLDPATNDITTIFEEFKNANLDAASAVQIFGRRNAAAALVLAQGAEKVGELTEANQNAQGSAADLAAEMRDTLSGSLKSLNSAFEEMLLSAGDSGLLGAFRTVVDVTADLIRMFSGAEAQMVEMQMAGIALGATLETVWATILYTWEQTMTGLEVAGNFWVGAWTKSINGLSQIWDEFSTNTQTVFNAMAGVLEATWNFTIDQIALKLAEFLKTILESDAALAVLDKMGVSAKEVGDAYGELYRANLTFEQQLQKSGKAVEEENNALLAGLEERQKARNEESAYYDQEDARLKELKQQRADDFKEEIAQIEEIAQARAEALGKKEAEETFGDDLRGDDEESAGPSGISPSDAAAAEEEIAQILEDAQQRKLDLLSQGYDAETQMREEERLKRKEELIAQAEEEKEFVLGLHDSAFESEQQRADTLESIEKRHLENMSMLNEEYRKDDLKRSQQNFRSKLQGVNQYMQAAAALDEAFGNGSLANSKAFGVAQAVVSTAVGISRAMELGFPAAYPAMALAAATGAAQIAAILGATKGSSSAPTAAAGGAGAVAAAGSETGAAGTAGGNSGALEQTIRIEGLTPGSFITAEMAEATFNALDSLIDDDFRPRNLVVSQT